MQNIATRVKTIFCFSSFLVLSYTGLAQHVSVNDIMTTEKMVDLHFTNVQRDSMVNQLNANLQLYRYLHGFNLPNSVPLPNWFDPVLPAMTFNTKQQSISWNIPADVVMPADTNRLAFYTIAQLSSLLRHHKITSVQLSRFFINRLKKYGDTLHCVISLTEKIAMEQAKQADEAFAKGIYKSPLQGIPYGLKDLFAVKGTRTTYGTPPFKDQVIDEDAFVYRKLDKAGAVLIAKLSMGELAMDDIWFGGQTKNPWNLNEGSNGSSAGSASATVAGLLPFAIGTETYGSIVAPSAVCGATGLRPTFGSVARTGGMNLAWTSDRIGPICRDAEDAAMVFAYIHGSDLFDRASRTMPFNYTGNVDLKTIKVAYAKNYIDTLPGNSAEKAVIKTLQDAGVQVKAIDFPSNLHTNDLLTTIWAAESATAFDYLTRSGRDSEMVQQWQSRYPNQFRSARFIPAVEYLTICRLRYMVMQYSFPLLSKYDIIIVPSMADEPMALTCLTGNPCITLPAGLAAISSAPPSITFIGGKLYSEATIAAFAKWFQQHTHYQQQHPPMFTNSSNAISK
ncbi:MAG: amidase [Sediminibacterium sp.]|jgi:Asp-tRNA(Asn)/Glu-tRNA(Gln) amidotransferase A subunit family amidase|nr:amidase [Chitinophagaceae bacterium]MCA6446641.1 amidase [Chitinophagaceae bacterium]